MRGLKDKVVIITGAAQGLGQATAFRFAEEGAKVVIADMADATGTLKTVKEKGVEAIALPVDVTKPDSVQAMVDKAIETFGRIDVLINNAGINNDNVLRKMTHDQFNKVINVNLIGVFNCTKAVIPQMLAQGSGVVLSASSVVGLYGNAGVANYAASKWAVIGMTKSWAKEMAKKGLRFNCVAPGFCNTEMVAKMPEKVVKEFVIPKTASGRLGEPWEIAAAYAFLASDDAQYINGTVLSVDGMCTL
ncbi:MAG: 3-oxoacyl-ACP reductase FabG [Heliobacteriaceae bacterium]|nr:3-oxoacyl-ACP reductase FabG [Heliobacteriaceae bacterium]